MTLALFGTPQLYADGVPARLSTRRAYQILARIAMLRGARIDRRTLVSTLWPDLDGKLASATLRREIERIEAAWRECGNRSTLLSREGRCVGFDSNATLEIDVVRFEAFYAADALLDAAAAYTADFFAEDGDAAIDAERQRLQAVVEDVLERLIEEARVEGRLSDAISFATRLQTFAPYRDRTVRALMQHRTFASDRRRPAAQRHRPVPASDVEAGRLPREPNSFVGREREVAQIGGILDRRRLITITGAPGMGKSRLATRVARLRELDFADGAYFVDLSTATASGDLERIALDAIAGDGRRSGDSLETLLAHRAALLVVDNCEHVREACAAVVEYVLAVSPATKILATSRRPLHVPPEVEWRLAPLELPASGGDDSDAALAPAVRLFLDRAEAVQPTGVYETPIAIAVSICSMLDGVPLALELAASRLRVTTLAELESLVRQRMPVLVDPYREARQTSLEAPYAWSYALLGARAQRAFRALAVFGGSFTLDAARAVCDFDGPEDARAALEEVLDHSMVVATAHADAADATAHYKLLFSAYELARKKLDESADGPGARERHAKYFIDKASSLAEHLTGAGRERVYPQLRIDCNNIIAALDHAFEHRSEVERGLETCVALAQFWTDAYRNTEGLRLLETALAAIAKDHPLYGIAARSASVLARQLSDVERAMTYAEAACEATARTCDLRAQLQAIVTLGSVYGVVGHIEGSLAAGLEGVEIARRLGSSESEVFALLTVAQAHLSLGDVAEARRTYARAVELGTQSGATREALIGLNNLAVCALYENDLSSAVAYADAALERARALMLPENEAWALSVRSSAAWRRGDAIDAIACSDETVAVARRIGAKILEIFLLEEVAHHLATGGDASLAGKLLGAADSARKQYDQPMHPIEEPRRQRDDAALADALGVFGYDAARSIGSLWPLHEAVGNALTYAKGPRGIRV